jgi:hypothetical protein
MQNYLLMVEVRVIVALVARIVAPVVAVSRKEKNNHGHYALNMNWIIRSSFTCHILWTNKFVCQSHWIADWLTTACTIHTDCVGNGTCLIIRIASHNTST